MMPVQPKRHVAVSLVSAEAHGNTAPLKTVLVDAAKDRLGELKLLGSLMNLTTKNTGTTPKLILNIFEIRSPTSYGVDA